MSLAVAVLVTAALLRGMLQQSLLLVGTGQAHGLIATGLFDATVLLLLYGNLVYQVARLGHYQRLGRHRPADPADLEAVFDGSAEPLVALIPSYKEELGVVRQTVLSAVLQDYPNRRIVLLVDDPPDPASTADGEALQAVRALPETLHEQFAAPAERFASAQAAFQERAASGLDPVAESARLADLFAEAAALFQDWLGREPVRSHVDRLFRELVWSARADALWVESRRWAQASATSEATVRRGYARLASLFAFQFEVFERKRFRNLSHEPNKAMNLNSYLALLGGRYRVHVATDGEHLMPAAAEETMDLTVPDATWVLTLDADSLLAHDYALRLTHVMRQPERERVGVVQTPYSAIPGAPGLLERTAGATTDVMHLLHQGATSHNAAYWVGANALLRMEALRSLVTQQPGDSPLVRRYIQDRTVIEDTESTIDLVSNGWSLYNYPARLAYSATPPDYGSLLIQRRRWANGGLLILPKLLRTLIRPILAGRLVEAALRVHYLISIATVNVALLILTLAPFERPLHSLLLPLSCLPYFALYARDLRLHGYRRRDLGHVYALNLLLVPVNLGGVLKSLQQLLTGRRIPFGRTPKTGERTAATPLYLVATLLLFASWTAVAVGDLLHGRSAHAVAVAGNAAALGYALTRYVGWRSIADDLTNGLCARVPAALRAREPALSR